MAFAFVFPGQGSQSVGMMAAYGDSPIIRSTFDEASNTLGQDLWQLVVEGPAELLAQTVNTQPLMLTSAMLPVAGRKVSSRRTCKTAAGASGSMYKSASGHPLMNSTPGWASAVANVGANYVIRSLAISAYWKCWSRNAWR